MPMRVRPELGWPFAVPQPQKDLSRRYVAVVGSRPGRQATAGTGRQTAARSSRKASPGPVDKPPPGPVDSPPPGPVDRPPPGPVESPPPGPVDAPPPGPVDKPPPGPVDRPPPGPVELFRGQPTCISDIRPKPLNVPSRLSCLRFVEQEDRLFRIQDRGLGVICKPID